MDNKIGIKPIFYKYNSKKKMTNNLINMINKLNLLKLYNALSIYLANNNFKLIMKRIYYLNKNNGNINNKR